MRVIRPRIGGTGGTQARAETTHWRLLGEHRQRQKVEPSLSTLEKLASVFEVTIMDFFNQSADTEGMNLPLMEKIRVIDTLGKEEKNALFKMIDLAVANKKMRDSLQTMLAH